MRGKKRRRKSRMKAKERKIKRLRESKEEGNVSEGERDRD